MPDKYDKPFYRAVEDRLNGIFKITFSENAAFTAAATAACGLSMIAGAPLDRVYPFAFVLMALAWCFASMSAGFLRQWYFIFYSAAFWFLPHLFTDAARNSAGTEEYTVLNDVLARLSELVISYAPKLLTDMDMTGMYVSQIFLSGSLLLFLAGFLARKSARRYRFYCEVRSKILQNTQK